MDPNSIWYEMHTQFTKFSVKIVSLIKPSFTENYSFICNGNFELFIDD